MRLPVPPTPAEDEARNDRRTLQRFLVVGFCVALAVFSSVLLENSVSLRGGFAFHGHNNPPQTSEPPAERRDEEELRQQLTQGFSMGFADSDGLSEEEAWNQAWRRASVGAVADSIIQVSQKTKLPRGIVLPLYDNIATLGISHILALRELGVDLPIEVPHCGDLHVNVHRALLEHDDNVRIYDVCVQASAHTIIDNADHKLFCWDLDECHLRFRNFFIKVLALLLSEFEEVMLMDADTLYFQSPMSLWDSKKYQETGTLFFHDRIITDQGYLAKRRPQQHNITRLEQYLSDFDAKPFQHLTTVPRPSTKPLNASEKKPHVSYEPSEWLRTSHSWNRRTGHQADSSLMLWNKKKQQRATAILGSFITRGGTGRPPSYGDKELYFIAAELAGAKYSFSDYGAGPISTVERKESEADKSVVCGDVLHYLPEDNGSDDPAILFFNSDYILHFQTNTSIHRSKARPASVYPGSMDDRGLPQECLFDLTVMELTPEEKALIARRQQLHTTATSWIPTTAAPNPSISAEEKTKVKSNSKNFGN